MSFRCTAVPVLMILFTLISAGASADFSRFESLKPIEDHLQKIVEKYDFKQFESKIGDPIDDDGAQRYPLEIGFSFVGSENILPFIKDMEAFEAEHLSFRVFSFQVCVTAEMRRGDYRPILFATIFANAREGSNAGKQPQFHSGVLQAALERLSFDSAIDRNKQIVAGKDGWLTNIRHESPSRSDSKVAITGYTFTFSRIVELARLLAESDGTAEVSVASLKSDLYSGHPLFRFELSAALNRASPIPPHAWEFFTLIDAAVSSSNGRISSLKSAPSINVQEKFGLPVEISFENLVTDEWIALKQKLSELKGEKVSLAGTSDKGMMDKGFTLRLKVVVEP
ncbi:PilN domain-containing protein [Candidatus Ozemobacteraceae bacterium]|nr:PilN domain-containing protein [Candidatus Ozemobacteraceae bacterium]